MSLAPRLLLLVVAAVIGAFGCARREAPPAPGAPQRIVSLAPSATEILFAIGAGDRVVAVDEASDYPPEVAALPKVGGMSVNYERLVAFQPALVVGVEDLQAVTLARARRLGLDVMGLDTTSYDRTMEAIRAVGERVGEPGAAARVSSRMESTREEVRRRVGDRPGPVVLAVAEAEPSVIAMGRGTFFDGLLSLVNARNAAPVEGFAPLSRETMAAMRPDIVLVGNEAEAAAMRRRFAALPHTPPRVLAMPPDILVRPGPRLADGLVWLMEATRGDAPGRAR